MRRTRRLVEVAVYAPIGAAATLVATLHRRRREPDVAVTMPRVRTVEPDAPARAVVTFAADTPVDALPIDGYDHLAASQVVDRLGALTPTELDLIDGYERAHRHRQSVLAKIAQLQT